MNLESELLRLTAEESSLTADERALRRCGLAKRLEEAGEYGPARDALGALWPGAGERPVLEDLGGRAAAEVLLRCGVLTGWIGGSRKEAGAQEQAKNLIGEALRAFEVLDDEAKAAEALTELAYCYWREGEFDEARLLLKDALARLGDRDERLQAVCLIRWAIVEKEATRYNDALRLLTEAAPLVERAEGDDSLRGKFHNELATVYENLSRAEKRADYRERAFIEYAASGYHFEQAGHTRYHACVENNVGFLFFTVGRYAEAHEHLDRARDLLALVGDSVHIAQVDETRARVLLAEGRNAEAERVAADAVRALEGGGRRHILAEALTTYGVASARGGRRDAARQALESAIEAAGEGGDAEGAGQAALTIIEELGDRLTPADLSATYARAADYLAHTRHPTLLARLCVCARRAITTLTETGLEGEKTKEGFGAPSNWKGFSFWKEVRRYERHLIERALADSGGLVTKAAKLLGFNHHQSLAALLKGRHKDLQRARSPVVPRRRSIIRVREPRKGGKFGATKNKSSVAILHVEDHDAVAQVVREGLEMEGWAVETCANGAQAVVRLQGDAPYDLLIFDDDLPVVRGVELIRLARALPHRARTPVIMLSSSDVEAEAVDAGADLFLDKPASLHSIVEAVARLLPKGGRSGSG
jgi:two-component system chemotaxis response regulator CheY